MRDGPLLGVRSCIRNQVVPTSFARSGLFVDLETSHFIDNEVQWNEVHRGEHPRKLGLLAGTFEDGSLSVYVVPDPEDVKSQSSNPIRPTFGGSLLILFQLTSETSSKQCIYLNHFSALS
jgi:hypothetical protein